MIFGLFVLAVSIIISAVSAFYSVTGLIAIFTGAFWPIVIMGGTLELGKITATVWLHKYWDRAGWQFKSYLVPAIVVLMLITSMGTFGYLSAAHLSQATANDDISAQVSLFDDKIKTEQDNIVANKKALQQMAAQVDQMLGRTTDDKGASKAVQIRKQQAKERKALQDDISRSQIAISKLQEERAPYAAKGRVAESHIGPIKYIAALIYGDNPNADLLERAVRWVIILLVFVFDPLALVLILAAEQTIDWALADRQKKKKDELDIEPLTDEQIDAIKTEAGVDDVVMTEHLFDTEDEFSESGEIAKELDETHAYLNKPWVWMKNTDGPYGYVPTAKEEITTSNISPDELYDFIDEGRKEDPIVITRISNPESNLKDKNNLDNILQILEDLQSKNRILESKLTEHTNHLNELKSIPVTDHLGNAITAPKLDQVVAPDLSINAEYSDIQESTIAAGFGTGFPMTPKKGDIYLRVDYLPSKLFKWNGSKWIEIDKTSTDRYSYDNEYIKHLIEKLDSGEYDADLLTIAEQEQIQRYLNE